MNEMDESLKAFQKAFDARVLTAIREIMRESKKRTQHLIDQPVSHLVHNEILSIVGIVIAEVKARETTPIWFSVYASPDSTEQDRSNGNLHFSLIPANFSTEQFFKRVRLL